MKGILYTGIFLILTALARTGPVLAEPAGPPDGLDVTVINTPANPVPVTIEGQAPPPVPYQEDGSDSTQSSNTVITEFSTVPDGYRLVIQDVAGRATAFTEEDVELPEVANCSLRISDNGAIFRSRPIPITGDPKRFPNIFGTEQGEIFSEPVVVYAEAGQQPTVSCQFNILGIDVPDFGTLSLGTSIAGKLIPVE